MAHPRLRAAGGATVLLLLAACVQDGGASAAPARVGANVSATTAVPAPTTSPAPSTAPPTANPPTANPPTTNPPTTGTSLASGATVIGALPVPASLNCPSIGPSVGFGTVSFVDFNGDGNAEVFRAYPVNNTWRVALEDGTGLSYDDEPLAIFSLPVFPQAPADVNGDGREEVFIVVGADPSTAKLGLFSLVGCNLTRAFDSGQPAIFRVGATVTHLDGVKCVDHNGDGTTDILQYHGTSTDGITYTIQTSVFTLLPAGFVVPLLAPPPFSTTSPGLFSTISCGDLTSVQLTG